MASYVGEGDLVEWDVWSGIWRGVVQTTTRRDPLTQVQYVRVELLPEFDNHQREQTPNLDALRVLRRVRRSEEPQDPEPAPGTLALLEQDAARAAESPPKALSDPGEVLQAGDALQSAASRMAEWIIRRFGHADPFSPEYEVYMAAEEAEDAVEAWTEARRAS